MTAPLRLAVVGVGRMGAQHAETLAALESIDVVAIADADPGAAGRVAASTGARSYMSLEELAD